MNWNLVFTIVLVLDLLVFTIYELAVILNFCIPNNLSNTYYHFDRKFRGTGKLFPCMLYILCATAMPIWAYFTYRLPDWRSHYAFLPILVMISLALVGVSARYKKSDLRIYFHYTVAILAAVFTVAWYLIVALQLSYILISFIIVMMITGALTRTLFIYPLFWFESAGFFGVLYTLLTISLVPEALL